jgi:catechol 2,3-dioxygenase-like lactoylglutathione lyase family enzyme
MPQITGILETALSVADPHKSAEFYQRLFGFRTLLESDRLVALDVAGRSVLLLFQAGATDEPHATPGGVIPGHGCSGRSHFAFSVSSDDLSSWEQRLAAAGVPIESTVNWSGGARSLYFRDLDGHLAELMTPGFWALGPADSSD